VKAIQGRLYAYGAISSHAGVGVYDPASGSWSDVRGTYRGQDVVGNSARDGTGVVNDIAFDERTGDLYLVGNWAPVLEMPDVSTRSTSPPRCASTPTANTTCWATT
jgi:glutamine cyclotransferase